MPPLNRKHTINATRVTLTRTSQILSSQVASRPSLSNQPTINPNKGIRTSTLIVVVAVSCGLATLVFLSCCFGCWRPLLDQWKLRKELKHRIRARENDRVFGDTDGTVSNRLSRETSSGTDTDSQHNITINEIMARQVFKDREQKAYRGEIKLRRLARAQDIMRSSQGLTLPVHFRNLKGKMKALSRSLTGTEIDHNPVTSDQSRSTSRACSNRSQSELEVFDPPDTDTVEPVDECEASLDTMFSVPSGAQGNMGRQSIDSANMFNTTPIVAPPAVKAQVHTDLESIPETD